MLSPNGRPRFAARFLRLGRAGPGRLACVAMPSNQPLPAVHSVVEASLCAQATACPRCAGPLDTDGAFLRGDAVGRTLTLVTACRTCGAGFEKRFDASGLPAAEVAGVEGGSLPSPWDAPGGVINPTEDASEVIDVAGWLTLFSLLAEQARLAGEKAATLSDRSVARQIRLAAAACVDEALKFFDADNDLPPDDAFFTDAARRQFWEHPELFTRQHLAELRFSLMKSG